MTRDKAINILARLAGGATQPSWDEIRKAVQFAFDVLSASPEDGVSIQFNDERTFKREQEPKGLDEAAEEYNMRSAARHWESKTEGEQIEDAFKAGAEWMAGQGIVADFEVNELAARAWLTAIDEGKFHKDIYDNFEPGDKVIVQIRKVK